MTITLGLLLHYYLYTESQARGTKRPGNETSTERNVQGTKRPLRTRNETSWERKVRQPRAARHAALAGLHALGWGGGGCCLCLVVLIK